MQAPIHTNRPGRKTASTFPKSSASANSQYPKRSLPACPSPGMQAYRDLLDIIVQCLMKEGLTFIEAYEEALVVGKLDPFTTVQHLSQGNPSTDRESLLEFKAHNASCRLQRNYAQVLRKYPSLLVALKTQLELDKLENSLEQ